MILDKNAKVIYSMNPENKTRRITVYAFFVEVDIEVTVLEMCGCENLLLRP